SLLIDYRGGPFTQDVAFDGGAGSTTSLTLQGQAVATETFAYGASHAGSISLDQQVISYTNVSAIHSTLGAGTVALNHDSPRSLTTAGSATAGTTLVTSSGDAATTFTNPTTALRLTGTGGSDTVHLNGFGSGFAAALRVAAT